MCLCACVHDQFCVVYARRCDHRRRRPSGCDVLLGTRSLLMHADARTLCWVAVTPSRAGCAMLRAQCGLVAARGPLLLDLRDARAARRRRSRRARAALSHGRQGTCATRAAAARRRLRRPDALLLRASSTRALARSCARYIQRTQRADGPRKGFDHQRALGWPSAGRYRNLGNNLDYSDFRARRVEPTRTGTA